MQRSAVGDDLARTKGSDTVQNLAAQNIMQQSGIPTVLPEIGKRLPGIGAVLSRGGDFMYENANDRILQELAQALLDPKYAATLANQSGTPLIDAMRYLTPLGVGGGASLNVQ